VRPVICPSEAPLFVSLGLVPCFVWESPEGRVVHELDRAVLVIGRDAVSDIIILEPAVSRRHALVQVDGDRVTVTDLGSSGGTRINGARLTPDLPSSLASADVIQLGRVALTFYVGSPPPAPLRLAPEPPPPLSAPPPPAARKKAAAARSRVPRTPPQSTPRTPVAAPASGPPWKWIALGAAFITVGLAGALVAVVATRDGESSGQQAEREPAPIERPEPNIVEPDPMAKKDPDPEPDPEPEPKVDPNRAPDGELPPRGYVSVADYPDLLELGDTYYPVSLVRWNGTRVHAVGGDGRTYMIPQADVTGSKDRVDLARRAARARQQLDPDDADAQLELAHWCARRYIKRETRLLANRVLELRPGDAEATELLRVTE